MEKKYLLAHDAGTGGDKAVLTDLAGRVIHSAYHAYPLNFPRMNWAEQDIEGLWQAVAATTRRVIEQAAIDPRQIAGLGISAQMFNLLPLDEHGQPLTQMLSWLDGRSVSQADRVLSGDLPKLLYRYTGNIPTAKDIIPKILWLKEERPDLWDRTAWLLDCKEYLLYRLTGQIAIDWHGASVFFLFDPTMNIWSEEACTALGIPLEKLPPAYPSTRVIGEVTLEAARQTGLSEGTPVVLCAGDVAAAQCGSGANASGKAHLCLGTATWVGLSSRALRNRQQKPFWALKAIDPEKWIIAGEMETGGGALMWFRDAFCEAEARHAAETGVSVYSLIGEMADSVEPGSDRLLFLPWLSGERAPVLDHYARGAFVGLSLGHTRSHMARAVMEGVAFHLRWIVEALEQLGLPDAAPIRGLNAIGGGSASQVWTRIISRITQLPLHVVEHPLEAGAIGTALTVAVGLGFYPEIESIDGLIRIQQTVEPDDRHMQRYESLYQEYRALYQALAPIYRRLHSAP
jgi:xylulokinase